MTRIFLLAAGVLLVTACGEPDSDEGGAAGSGSGAQGGSFNADNPRGSLDGPE